MACLLFLSLSIIVLCACDNNKFICYAIKSHDKSAQKKRNINKKLKIKEISPQQLTASIVMYLLKCYAIEAAIV